MISPRQLQKKKLAALLTVTLSAAVLIGGFLNCSGFGSLSMNGADSQSARARGLVSASAARPDQLLSVTNVNREVISAFDATTTARSKTFYTAINASSGRRAVVQISMDGSRSVVGIEPTGPSYFCLDPRQAPCANVPVPFGYAGGGTLAQNCASPIYFTGALEGSVDQIKSDLVCSSLTPVVPLNATPWRRSYQGAYAAFVAGRGDSTSNVYTINGTENKNYMSWQNNPAVPKDSCDQNTLNPIPCAEIQSAGDAVPGAPKSAGVWNGVYNDYAPTYHSFITMSVRSAAMMGSPGEFTDLGPIAWPANGHLAEDEKGNFTEAKGGGMGLVTGTTIVDKAGTFVYVFYADRSHGVHLPGSAGYEGRGSGMKVIRAPILANNTVEPGSFKTYFQGAFTDSALPAGFQKERIQDFYAAPGGRSDDIFGTPLKVYSRFGVTQIANSDYYLGASLEDGHVLLRVSADLVHWSEAAEVTSLAATDPEWWRTTKMLNVTPLAASGLATNSVDVADFYLLGTDIGQAGLNKVHLSARIDSSSGAPKIQILSTSAVSLVDFQGDRQPLETVPTLVSLVGQPSYLLFATDWTNRCPISAPLTGAVRITNSSCLFTMESDIRKNQYFPLGADPTTSVNITNINREISGTFRSQAVPVDATESVYEVRNPVTGRSAKVRISLAPTTRSVIGVRPFAAPYFCYDHGKPACDGVTIPAGFTGAGTISRNCSSPVYYSGAVNGSIANLAGDIQCP